MKTWQAVAFGVLCGLLGAGLLYLVSRPVRGEPVQLLPAPTPAPLLIQVDGSVAHPGLYVLPVGSRVHDALDSAGGLLPEASTQSLNLAAPLQDGVRIFVPSQGQTGSEPGDESQTSEVATGNPININIATQAELESLPHIGPSLAGEIITYRQEHGPFSTIEEIMNVPGIGQGIFEEIKNWIVVQ